MGYSRDDYMRKGFMQFQNSPKTRQMKKFLSHTRHEFIAQEMNKIDMSSILNTISDEFHSKYKQIYSIYHEHDHLELTNSITKEELSYNLHEVLRSSYSYPDSKLSIHFEWSLREEGIEQNIRIDTIMEDIKWNIRRLNAPISKDKFVSIPEEPIINLLNWNEDYCLDILPYEGSIITIWICLRKYS